MAKLLQVLCLHMLKKREHIQGCPKDLVHTLGTWWKIHSPLFCTFPYGFIPWPGSWSHSSAFPSWSQDMFEGLHWLAYWSKHLFCVLLYTAKIGLLLFAVVPQIKLVRSVSLFWTVCSPWWAQSPSLLLNHTFFFMSIVRYFLLL